MSLNALKISTLKLFLFNKTPLYLSFRYARNRHRVTKFAILNNYQPWSKPIEISKVMEDFDSEDPSELRDKFRRKGILPMNSFIDVPINLNCTTGAIDNFVPPEGDGKSNFLSFEKAKETGKSSRIALENIRFSKKIRKFEPSFDRTAFVQIGEEIYREVLSLLPDHQKDPHRLLQLTTEHGLTEMVSGLHNRTLELKFLRHIEPPSLVKVQVTEGATEGQMFGQVTLRIFSEQMVAIYDRFGRLIYGSDSVPMDMLEYVVFEKQVSEEYGSWRVHTKIVPDWMPKKLVYHRSERLQEVTDSDAQSASSVQ